MKKFFMIVLVMVVSLTCVFAAKADVATTIGAVGDKSLDVTLEVIPGNMYYYSIGFINSIDGLNNTDAMAAVPTAYDGPLALTYDPANSTGSNAGSDLFFFYKAKTANAFTVTLTMGGDMAVTSDDNNAKALKWYATVSHSVGDEEESFTQTELASSGAKNATTVAVGAKDAGIRYGAYKIALTTDPVPVLSKKANYAGSLTLGITAE